MNDKAPKKSSRRLWLSLLLVLVLPSIIALTGYVLYLDHVVQKKFEGKRWAVPSRVYARALELYPGQFIHVDDLHSELKLIGYRESSDGLTAGSYLRRGNQFVISIRAFQHWDGQEPARSIKLEINADRLSLLIDASTGESLNLIRLEPMQIGTIYPSHKEDRVLVQLEELPALLLAALLSIEDRKFASHHGIDWRGIFRAAWVNLRAGRVVQGGSTLTQQLVKNFYLNNERTLIRKFNEAIMSSLLELRYEKREILEAYVNEVYLGQDGVRAIHGFGLASEFYFNKPAREMTPSEVALLVAVLRGPTYYDPRRYADRALKRRNQILDKLYQDDLIDQKQVLKAKQSSLNIAPKPNRGHGLYPAFIDLVKRDLQKDYREDDLMSEGLRIFTTLDPIVQKISEKEMAQWIQRLEKGRDITPDTLQGGIVITRVGSAEVVAVVGGRNVRFEGFNRALDIQRPVGSLLKPALYLAALEQKYTLASLVDDEAIQITMRDGQVWNPENYDQITHGSVLLVDALSHSYNLAAVNLGVELGLDKFVKTLHKLGVERKLPHYPSLILGATEMAPIDMAQMYQTLADSGFYTPLRSVREVLTQRGVPLQRYSLDTEQRFDSDAVSLVNYGLREAFRHGTGQSVAVRVPESVELVGKTGTTDDLRDSWFAGFGQDFSGVVWLGGDNNQAMGLTGSSGALQIWADIMVKISRAESDASFSPNIETILVDRQTGLRADQGCIDTELLPFIIGTAPNERAPCAKKGVKKAWDKFKGLFQ